MTLKGPNWVPCVSEAVWVHSFIQGVGWVLETMVAGGGGVLSESGLTKRRGRERVF